MNRYVIVSSLMLGVCFGLLTLLYNVNFPEVHYLITGCLFMLIAVCDHVTTWIGLSIGATEANPLTRFIFNRIGFRSGSLLILLGLLIFVLICWNDLPVYAQLSLILAYSIVPVNNFIVLRKRRKR